MIWQLVAWVVSRPRVADWLIERAQRTPYSDIVEGGDVYMRRWWLFNPYDSSGGLRQFAWLPSIRVHHIVRPDRDRNQHDHPWNCRTIVLRHGYAERRGKLVFLRLRGNTARIGFNEFHSITHVHTSGAWTLFLTGRYRGTWGFKVPYREYLGLPDADKG